MTRDSSLALGVLPAAWHERMRPSAARTLPFIPWAVHRISNGAPEGDDMTASAGIATAPYEELAATVRGETAGAKAAIVIVCREPSAREILNRELSKRYGADYQIVVCDRPAELEPWMRDLLAAGLPVALVIGAVGAQDPDGIGVLAATRAIDPTALRVAAVRWGDWESVRSIFDAVTLDKIDHWVTRPVQTPAEEFHRSITEFLREWRSGRGGGCEAVRVIGEQWSARSQERRDLFSRHRVPAGFYDATSERDLSGQRQAGELGDAPVAAQPGDQRSQRLAARPRRQLGLDRVQLRPAGVQRRPVVREPRGQRRLIEALPGDPPLVRLRPGRPGPPDPAVPHQHRGDPLLRPLAVRQQRRPGPDQVPDRLLRRGRHPDRRQLPGPVQPGQPARVPLIGLDPLPGPARDQRRRDHITGHPH